MVKIRHFVTFSELKCTLSCLTVRTPGLDEIDTLFKDRKTGKAIPYSAVRPPVKLGRGNKLRRGWGRGEGGGGGMQLLQNGAKLVNETRKEA